MIKKNLIIFLLIFNIKLYADDDTYLLEAFLKLIVTGEVVLSDDKNYYRTIKLEGSWKDNLGDWGKLECAGNHTITKGKGTTLINYCLGTNKDGDTFRFIMNRVSDDFDTGIGKIKYDQGSGKFKKYEKAECVYAITFLPNRDASFIKTKCNFNK